MNGKEIVIVGAGSYGEVLLELAQINGFSVSGFYDDDEIKKGTVFSGVPVLGTTKDLFEQDLCGINVAVAIGKNKIRRNILERVRENGGSTPSLVHPTAEISSSAVVGRGVYIQPKALIWTKVIVEDDCIISPGVIIGHHSTMKQGSFVSALSCVGGNVMIHKEAFIGIGCTIMTGVESIGSGVIVGAGSVVIRNVPNNVTVVGVPGKIIKTNGI